MEKSESGAPIYRYTASKKNDFEIATGGNSIQEKCRNLKTGRNL